jgi:DNA-binding FadR family transcriptional regulator
MRSLHEAVVADLGSRIVNGEISQGSLLPKESILATQLKVSRTALREALKVLGAKGLIESRTKVGTRVRPEREWMQLDSDVLAWRCTSMPRADFIRKLMQMRQIIEPGAAALAAEFGDDKQLSRLTDALRAMESSNDVSTWAEADLRFHQCLLEATSNELLISLFSVVARSLDTFFVLSARTANNFKYSLPFHERVLTSVLLHDANAARAAMYELIEDSSKNALSGLTQGSRE